MRQNTTHYLLSALLTLSVSCDAFTSSIQSVSRHRSLLPPLRSTFVAETEDLQDGIEAIDRMNPEFQGTLDSLRHYPYFRLYSCDMLGSCEYMPQELFECYSQSCEIYPVDEDEVPNDIMAKDSEEHDFELDGWARWDMPSEDYYDTDQFPESYTGYDGAIVWKFIHERICFNVNEDDEDWKADFNKAVSGLHSMISAQVIKGIEEKLEEGDDEVAGMNVQAEFQRRLSVRGETPHALENLYFGYMLMLSAVNVAKSRILSDCAADRIHSDEAALLQTILSSPLLENPSVKVAYQKLHDHAVKDEYSKSALWEARMRTRDLMRIMNCVQCNKCRLHGKISVLGVSTALQILLGRTGEGGDPTRIHRVELAALLTTVAKFSNAIEFCARMSK
mmetsp:Transcript_1079/g.1699  ORF Transcript_1079/g.1699 Transcript_1079/m.1699 type:complete len:391 (-) Transcript_1079:818-1990(-)|eukprot:CAMPEP_0196801716 /NCGR_PEP_ID=MMETSP1362-20130617/1491_1 /TAXON_ID=163516 /ORGANISM="Leptocylindrus danicus, Strain CCMP1856" /LENGTH=390 /DNA_ID=CAMNT_0042172805 /DNA_START=69 /DNA_END=1241 /DNA_ORIENTATION=-